MISVIIVNFNSGDRLARCLAALSRQTFRNFETIVFDNGSSDDSIARADGASARFVRSPNNLGFAAANNRAAKIAAGDWLAFLNPDAYPQADWLDRLCAATARYPMADAFGSAQFDAASPSRIDGAGDVYHAFGVAYRGHFGWPSALLPEDAECFSPCAAAAMYRKSAFESLGGFDERFFCYGEDVDLGFRLRLSGGRAVQLNAARVLHEGSGVTGRHSDFSVYHGHRNRIWIARKNLPGLLFWGLSPLRLLVDAALFARMILLGRAGAYLRAMRDGYFGGGAIRREAGAARRNSRLDLADIVSLLAWSPIALARRRAVLKPIATMTPG